MAVTLRNELPQHTSVHWHGLRLPNAMDGVQYVTQPPVEPGERFRYDFTLADTGTFFFHPHCNESGQVGHGLAGVLIVEGDESVPSGCRSGARGEGLAAEPGRDLDALRHAAGRGEGGQRSGPCGR